MAFLWAEQSGRKKEQAGRGKPDPVQLVFHIIASGDYRKMGLFFPDLCSTKAHLHDNCSALKLLMSLVRLSLTADLLLSPSQFCFFLCFFFLSQRFPKFGCRLPVTFHPLDLIFDIYMLSKQRVSKHI